MKLLPYLKCPICEHPAIDGATHPKCQTSYTIDGLTSFFRYDGIVKKAIKKIKYRYVSDIVSELISCTPTSSFSILTKLLSSKPLSFFFVPIPLHPSRFRNRGFNQAEVIAQALNKRLNIPVKTDVLIRIKKTTPQVEMKKREERLKNMKDVFAVSFPELKKFQFRECERKDHRAILLIDDVFTTGATLRSAASILKHAGVKFVWGITLAQ
jgi:ComF family protein